VYKDNALPKVLEDWHVFFFRDAALRRRVVRYIRARISLQTKAIFKKLLKSAAKERASLISVLTSPVRVAVPTPKSSIALANLAI
jgi:hypothetical protein